MSGSSLHKSHNDDGSIKTITDGIVADGYIENARVFRDEDGDGKYDAAEIFTDENGNGEYDEGEDFTDTDTSGTYTVGEAFTTTDENGVYTGLGGSLDAAVVADDNDGQAVDVSTGLEFVGSMSAPAGSTVINPLTTVLHEMVKAQEAQPESERMSIDDLNVVFLEVMGLEDGLDLTTYDPLKWSSKFGQRAKMYPTRTNGYENDKTTKLFRPV